MNVFVCAVVERDSSRGAIQSPLTTKSMDSSTPPVAASTFWSDAQPQFHRARWSCFQGSVRHRRCFHGITEMRLFEKARIPIPASRYVFQYKKDVDPTE